MKPSMEYYKKHKFKGCKALCCSFSCRLSASSSAESKSSSSYQFLSISSLAHVKVQERLNQMIRERQQARQKERRKQRDSEGITRVIIMVAMQKSSYDPREDFRCSMVEMILSRSQRSSKSVKLLYVDEF